MAVVRGFAAQGLYEPFLPRSGGQQVACPHYAGDAHLHVIHRNGQLIGKYPVGAADDEVPAAAREVLAVRAVVAVINGYFCVRDYDLRSRSTALRGTLGV